MLLRPPPTDRLHDLVRHLPLAPDDPPKLIAALERELMWYRDAKAERSRPPRFPPTPTRLLRRLRAWAQEDPDAFEYALGPVEIALPSTRGPKSLDRDLVDRVPMVLQVYGIRPARGDKFRFLRKFLKGFCKLVAADRPNIDRALEVSAREWNARARPAPHRRAQS
jgi:hypothetical protein